MSNVTVDDVFQIFLTTRFWLGIDILALDPCRDLIELQLAAQYLLGFRQIPLLERLRQRAVLDHLRRYL